MQSQEPKEDFLTEDNEIPGQRFCLLSFLSPENVLAKKELYYFEKFLSTYEIQWKTKNLEAFLAKQVNDFNAKLDAEAGRLDSEDQGKAADICRASRARLDEVLTSYQEYLKKNAAEISQTKLKDAYDDFIYAHGKKVEDEFYAKNDFRTTVRGLKVRGSYSTHDEAAARAKKLQKNDTVHNIFVGEVGKWLPWDPAPSDVKEQEYAEEQLNTLMKSYKDNEDAREMFYNKHPDAKKDAYKNAGPKKVVSITRDEGESTEGHNSMFNDVDLALQRKMEREAKAAKDA